MGTPLFGCFLLLAGCDVISVTDRNPLLFSGAVCVRLQVCFRRKGGCLRARDRACVRAFVCADPKHDLPTNLLNHSLLHSVTTLARCKHVDT